jgi:hypothetical protein
MSSTLPLIVDPAYRHVDKISVPLGARGRMKWFDLLERDRTIDPSVRTDAMRRVDELVDANDIGFVILHQCDNSVYLLLVCRWRNNNEIWETVFAKRADADFAVVADDDPTRASFCVWELGIVNAERLAWAEYLRSNRDESALEHYLGTGYAGVV